VNNQNLYRIISLDKEKVLQIAKAMFKDFLIDESHLKKKGKIFTFEKLDSVLREIPMHLVDKNTEVYHLSNNEIHQFHGYKGTIHKTKNIHDFLALKTGSILQSMEVSLIEYIQPLISENAMTSFKKIQSTTLYKSILNEIKDLMIIEMSSEEDVINESIQTIFKYYIYFRNAKNMDFNTFNNLFIQDHTLGGKPTWI